LTAETGRTNDGAPKEVKRMDKPKKKGIDVQALAEKGKTALGVVLFAGVYATLLWMNAQMGGTMCDLDE